MIRPLFAEALGTALLCIATLGPAFAAPVLLPGGAEAALAGAIWALVQSLCIAAGLFALITLTLPVSGGHINPAVTLLFYLRGEIGARAGLVYGLVQILGAVAAVLLLQVLWGQKVWQTGLTPRTGLAYGLSEVLASFGLAFVISAGLFARLSYLPLLVGCFALIVYWALPSGGLQNPAVLIARALTDHPAGIRPIDLPLGLAAMTLGTWLGWASGRWLFAMEPRP